MLRFSLYPDSAPISVSVRPSRRNLVQISILAPIGLAGGLVRGISALSELASGLKTETLKAELARQTKDARSMWSRRLRAIQREYARLRSRSFRHRAAVKHLVDDYRWRDLGWGFQDFNRHVNRASDFRPPADFRQPGGEGDLSDAAWAAVNSLTLSGDRPT